MPSSLEEYIARQLNEEGQPENGGAVRGILTMAIREGLSVQDLAEMTGHSVADINTFVTENYPELRGDFGTWLGNSGSTGGTSTTGGTTTGTTGVTGNVVNGSGSNGSPDATWSAIEQGNVDYNTALQNSIFNNPNITLADGSTQTVSFGNLPDWESYVRNNPDLYQDFVNSPNNPFTDMAAYGRWHYQTYGQSEGREIPTGSPSDLGFLQPEISVNLSPEEQAIYDANQHSRGILANTAAEQLGRVQSSFNTPIDPSFLHDPSQYLDSSGAYQQTIDPTVGGMESVRDAMVDRYQPLFDRRRDNLKNDLMVQGHNPGNESWNNQFDDLNRAENDFYLGAMEQAGQEQQRLFNMEGMRRQQDISENQLNYGMGTDWRGRQIDETLLERNLPLNEYNALMTGTQMPLPNMTPYSGTQIQSPDYAGAAQEQYNRNLYNQQMDQQQNNMRTQGLFQLGGAALGGPMGGQIGNFVGGLFG